MTRRLKHIVMGLLLVMAWLGAAADGTGRLKNYDIWKDLPSKTLMEMGRRYCDNEKPDSALMCFNIVINRYYLNYSGKDKKELELIVEAMNGLGFLYNQYYFDYEKANKYLLQAEKIAKENHFLPQLSFIYINLSNIYLIENSFKNRGSELDIQTIVIHRKAFETSLEAQIPRGILIAAANMANIATDSLAMCFLREDLKQFLNYQIPDSLSDFEYVKLYCQADIEQDLGNIDKALFLYDKALNKIPELNSRDKDILKRSILYNKCRLLFKQHKDKEVIKIYNEILKHDSLHNDHHSRYVLFQSLYEYYHNVKYDSILSDKYDYLTLQEKEYLQDKNKLLDAEKAEFLFQIDEINAEVQELAYRHRLMKIIAWCIAAFVLLILGFLYLLWRKYKQEQEKNRKLYENNIALLAAEEERRQQVIEAEQNKYQSHQMEEGEQSDLLHRILYIMETSDEVYQENFSLDRLTQLVDVKSPNYVSQVLNEHYDHTFKEMLNDYRIREACRRINDREHYSQFTVQAIAQSVGFGSYPNFVTNFKKFTGLTPSAYRKQGKDKSGPHADNAD